MADPEEGEVYNPLEEKEWFDDPENFRLLDPSNLDLFVLWRKLTGMGGESLKELMNISEQEGSSALIRDFLKLLAIEAKFKVRKRNREDAKKKAELWRKSKRKSQ